MRRRSTPGAKRTRSRTHQEFCVVFAILIFSRPLGPSLSHRGKGRLRHRPRSSHGRKHLPLRPSSPRKHPHHFKVPLQLPNRTSLLSQQFLCRSHCSFVGAAGRGSSFRDFTYWSISSSRISRSPFSRRRESRYFTSFMVRAACSSRSGRRSRVAFYGLLPAPLLNIFMVAA